MRVFLASTLLASTFGLAAGTSYASASNFMEYCQNSNTSKAGKFTLKIISEDANSNDCAAMETYLKSSKGAHLSDDNLTDLTALSFFEHFTSMSLTSKQDLDLSQLGNTMSLKRIVVDAPLTKLTNLGESLRSVIIENAPKLDLTGLSKHPNITFVNFYNTKVSSFAEVNKLSKLKILDVEWGNIAKLSEISGLHSLEHLHLNSNDLSDLSGIEHFHKLESLAIAGNDIQNLAPLAKLTQLTSVDISSNPARDFSPLYGLKNLSSLDLSSLEISDLSFLSHFKNLAQVYLDHNEITDLEPLAQIASLKRIRLEGNLIKDVSPLNALTELASLDVGRNFISQMPKINAKMNDLDVSHNNIRSLEGLDVADGAELWSINLAHNAISSLKGIESVKSLKNLTITGNRVYNLNSLSGIDDLEDLAANDNRIYDVSGLDRLRYLKWVNLSDNRITSLAPIKDSFIEVLRMDDNPLGYDFKRYPATCPKDARSAGVAQWCKRPIKRSRAGGWVIGIPDRKAYHAALPTLEAK